MPGKRHLRFLAIPILAALVVTLAVDLPGVSADDGEEFTLPPKADLKYPNLGSHLDQLAARVEEGEMSEGQAAGETAIRRAESVAVTI